MRCALVTHPSSSEHVSLDPHPERPERLTAAIEGVYASGLDVVEVEARAATREELLAVHDGCFLDRIRTLSAAGGGSVDADTYVVRSSWDAAVHAAGAGLTAIEVLDGGDASVAFVAVRPPGHHAERGRAMGFCLINNVAVTAAALVGRGERVAIVDWDVHHGNGTQEIFFPSSDVLYLSIHHSPFYPGTGRVDEVGRGLGIGATLNVPIAAGSDGDVYRQAFERIVVPVLDQFGPDRLLVSAGYDGHRADPLGGMAVMEVDYRAMAAALGGAMGRENTVFFLEGGYDLEAVRDSVAATLVGFTSGEPALEAPAIGNPSIDRAVEVISLFWDVD